MASLSASRNVLRKTPTTAVSSIKHGIGRLTACADTSINACSINASKTRLTRVSHKAPTRLLPMTGKSSIGSAGAAVCALSNYGGGMLQGDSCELSVHVKPNARLGIITQGASRIYKRRNTATTSTTNTNTYESIVEKEIGNNTSNTNTTTTTTTSTAINDCRATLNAQLDKDALLVLAPDPCSLFAKSSFVQKQHFELHPNSSLALIDWFSSGRYRNGEAWEFDHLTSTTQLSMHDNVFLQDSTTMDLRITKRRNNNNGRNDNNRNADPMVGISDCHAFASMILYGDQVDAVQERCYELQDSLAIRTTRIRDRSNNNTNTNKSVKEFDITTTNTDMLSLEEEEDIVDNGGDAMLQSLAGKVYMGVSRVDVPFEPDAAAHVVRLGATTNEDIYRILHHCLQPLSPKYGMEFYGDRIRAKASEIPHLSSIISKHKPASQTIISKKVNWNNNKNDTDIKVAAASDTQKEKTNSYLDSLLTKTQLEEEELASSSSSSSDSWWSAYMLADSSMPTGSFAHSAGLEAAAQLGMIQMEEDVESFIQAATRSTMQVTVPFLLQGHRLATSTSRNGTNLSAEWKQLDERTQAVLASNAPACAASLDQGKSLARVALQWLSDQEDEKDVDENRRLVLEHCLRQSDRHHIGPTLGVVAALLRLTPEQACRLFGYCVARDMVSAAVRLSLVGPLASVGLLQKIQEAADVGLEASVRALQDLDDADADYMAAAGASAPVIEAIHPCHDLLQTRLFRS